MLTLDLFKSSYEQSLLEGRVDEVITPEEEDDGPPIPSNLKQFSTPNNWGVVSGKWAEIQDAVRLNVPYVTLNWPTSGTATLTRNQLWTIYQRAVKMSRPKRTSWGLTTLNDPKNLLYWIANTKIIARPEQKRPPADPSQGELPLDDLKEKKSSEISVDSPYKDVRVQRAVKKAAFDNPAAASPEEAFIKSMLDAQDKDQEDIAKLRQSTQQQRELLSKNIKKDNEQENLISNISSEIQKVDQENHSLQKMQQNMAAANARLQKTLDAMRGKKVEPAPTSNVGVSVATDKIQEPTVAVEPAPTQDDSAQIQKLRSTIARLTKQMKNRLDQGQNDELITQLRTQIGSLKDQLAQVTNQPPQQLDLELGKPEQKSKPKSKTSPVKYRRVAAPQKTSLATGLDVEPIDIGPGPTAVHENNMIESQEEFVFYINGKPAAKYQNEADALRDMAIIKKKYPDAVLDLKQEVCNLETIKYVAEGSSLFEELPSKATYKLQQWKNQRNQQAQQAQPVATTAPVEPQPQPARLSDLQARHQKVEALFKLKKAIEIAKDKATKGGRILPRGLAADLEDYYSMDDIDTHYDQMLAAYQKQLKAIEQYLSMKKILNKKVTHEDTKSELYANAVAKIKKALANPKLDPATRRDYEARLQKFLNEGRAGYNPLTSQEHWQQVKNHLTKLLASDMPYADKQVVRQRYLEKQKEAQQKGWEK